MSGDTLVLCYHALSERFPAQLSTTPRRFARQLQWLARHGYRGVTFTAAIEQPSERNVAVTFDDGYRSVAALARPILDRLDWPATIFVPTDYIGQAEPMSWPGIDRWLGGEHERELLPLGWQELRELADHGWEIGSHTCSHPHLTTLDADALTRELTDSKAVCEAQMERPCKSLAYPYGDVDPRVVRATAAAGYATAAALPGCIGVREALESPRVGVYFKDHQARFALKCSPLARRLRERLTSLGERRRPPLPPHR